MTPADAKILCRIEEVVKETQGIAFAYLYGSLLEVRKHGFRFRFGKAVQVSIRLAAGPNGVLTRLGWFWKRGERSRSGWGLGRQGAQVGVSPRKAAASCTHSKAASPQTPWKNHKRRTIPTLKA